ncbi:MAG TPA: hypothetical protein VHH09_00380 [Acidimicrobiales bacterium]|nr:hypothetical protein [Acidimicrobiales bacterium]
MATRPGALDPARRLLLSRAKLTALVRAHWDVGAFDGHPRPAVSGLVARRGDQGWMLVEEETDRALGRGLLWALRSGVRELHYLFSADDEAASPAARRGRLFDTRVAVWRVQGTELSPVVAEPLRPEAPLDPGARPYTEVLAAAGADPVVEWGSLYGDVWGLEAARVEREDGELWLGVGVTKEDRLTHRLMWGDEPGVDAVRSVVDQVRYTREQDDLAHPLNQLARERWLRAWLLRDPGQVGATALEAVSPPAPRPDDVRIRRPAAAVGPDRLGAPMLVVCSVGFDSEALPMALELAEAANAQGGRTVRLVLVQPARDDHPLLRLARDDALLPVELATVPDDWPRRCREELAGPRPAPPPLRPSGEWPRGATPV